MEVTAYGDSPPLDLRAFHTVAGGAEELGSRRAFFPEADGFVDTPVYDRYGLAEGRVIEGPAIIEERESTTVIPPGLTAEIEAHGTARVEVTS